MLRTLSASAQRQLREQTTVKNDEQTTGRAASVEQTARLAALPAGGKEQGRRIDRLLPTYISVAASKGSGSLIQETPFEHS
jgi:hypothetical protein